MRLFLTFLCLLGLAVPPLHGQSIPYVKSIVDLVNEARTDPQGFLKKHESAIVEIDPSYIPYLQKVRPQTAVIWDKALETMAKATVVNGNLDPDYAGKNELCSYASGKISSSEGYAPLTFVVDNFTNVHGADYKYIGIYADAAGKEIAWQWGKPCNLTRIPFTYDGGIDSSGVDFKQLATADHVVYLSTLEHQMVQEINLARAYPRVYAQIVRKYLADKSAQRKGLTADEHEAGMDLLEKLETMSPASILTPLECLSKTAKDHAAVCKARGVLDHEGKNGSHPHERILQGCPDLEDGNENLVNNSNPGVRIAVLELLIDDGIPGRGHRENLLDPAWSYVGVSYYLLKQTGSLSTHNWVQNFGR